jgi:hypothetical protein
MVAVIRDTGTLFMILAMVAIIALAVLFPGAPTP